MKITKAFDVNTRKEIPWYYGFSHYIGESFTSYYYPIPINKIAAFFIEVWTRLKYNRFYFKVTFAGLRQEVLSLENQIEKLNDKIKEIANG